MPAQLPSNPLELIQRIKWLEEREQTLEEELGTVKVTKKSLMDQLEGVLARQQQQQTLAAREAAMKAKDRDEVAKNITPLPKKNGSKPKAARKKVARRKKTAVASKPK